MTKAKMPVAKHHLSRAEDARAYWVRTEELTLIKASADCVGLMEHAATPVGWWAV